MVFYGIEQRRIFSIKRIVGSFETFRKQLIKSLEKNINQSSLFSIFFYFFKCLMMSKRNIKTKKLRMAFVGCSFDLDSFKMKLNITKLQRYIK